MGAGIKLVAGIPAFAIGICLAAAANSAGYEPDDTDDDRRILFAIVMHSTIPADLGAAFIIAAVIEAYTAREFRREFRRQYCRCCNGGGPPK